LNRFTVAGLFRPHRTKRRRRASPADKNELE